MGISLCDFISVLTRYDQVSGILANNGRKKNMENYGKNMEHQKYLFKADSS